MELVTGAIAAGGGCVARAEDGRVVFVRHALPGERVLAEVTAETTSFLRADAVEILEPSPDRVEPPCPHAGPGRCGGCDWQHVSLAAQRRPQIDAGGRATAPVGRYRPPVEIEKWRRPMERADGLGWRTRVRFAVDAAGRAGFHRQPVPRHRTRSRPCPIASGGGDVGGGRGVALAGGPSCRGDRHARRRPAGGVRRDRPDGARRQPDRRCRPGRGRPGGPGTEAGQVRRARSPLRDQPRRVLAGPSRSGRPAHAVRPRRVGAERGGAGGRPLLGRRTVHGPVGPGGRPGGIGGGAGAEPPGLRRRHPQHPGPRPGGKSCARMSPRPPWPADCERPTSSCSTRPARGPGKP